MAKQRMIAGFALQKDGIITPDEPIKCKVSVPHDAQVRTIQIDAKGNFVLFAEVWSHPEGTKVTFREMEFAIVAPNKVIPAGSWEYYQTLVAGAAFFCIFTKGQPKLIT